MKFQVINVRKISVKDIFVGSNPLCVPENEIMQTAINSNNTLECNPFR